MTLLKSLKDRIDRKQDKNGGDGVYAKAIIKLKYGST